MSPSACSTRHRLGACSLWHTGHCSSQYRSETISGLYALHEQRQTGPKSSSQLTVPPKISGAVASGVVVISTAPTPTTGPPPPRCVFKPPPEPDALLYCSLARRCHLSASRILQIVRSREPFQPLRVSDGQSMRRPMRAMMRSTALLFRTREVHSAAWLP